MEGVHKSRCGYGLVPRVALLFGLVFCIASAVAAEDQDWEKQFETKTKELAAKNGNGTDQALKDELLKMRERDQDIRMREINAPADQKKTLGAQMEQTDKELTQRLEEIVAAKGWPTIRLVGIQASQAAAIILIHTPDHEFQRKMLPQLEKLVDDDQIVGSEVALITDKLLVADGKLQRFGTQFDMHNDKMIMDPVEDPGHLDQRREKYLLPPMAVYKKMLADAYHMPVE